MKKSENNQVPTSQWVQTRIMMSKSFLAERDIQNAIRALNDICFILPSLPIHDLQYIETVLKDQPMEHFEDESEFKLKMLEQEKQSIGSLTYKGLKTPRN